MGNAFLLFEERRAWVRSRTHTVVFERDIDFDRFAADPTGHVDHVVRIWLAELNGRRAQPSAYLGAVRVSGRDGRVSRRTFVRVEGRLRRAGGVARHTRALRAHLAAVGRDARELATA